MNERISPFTTGLGLRGRAFSDDLDQTAIKRARVEDPPPPPALDQTHQAASPPSGMLSELEVDRTLPAPPSVRSESLPPPVVLYHPSGIPAALRLPDDVIHLILGELVLPPHFADAHDSPSGVPCPGGAASTSAQPLPTSPVADLKRLALTHSHFLGPIRTMIYSAPNLEGTVGDQRDPCSCSSCQVGRSAHWSMAPLRKLSEALTLNPSLGAYVRHLDKFGDLTQFLSHLNISPSLVSRTILNILRKTPNLVSLDMPLVELRDQEDLIRAVTDMTALRTLTLSTGCVMTKDGTSMIHEGDLRRIASACVELEELEILTEHLGCGAADGWVEPFAFKELRVVRLVRATSLTDQHLLAMLSQSKHLTSLVIIKSAGLDGTSGVLVPGTTKRHHALTTTGIAQILERRGATLKHLTIDVTDQPPSTDSAPGTIPSIESALVKCPKLETLTLAGPGLILPSSLPHLGSPSPSKPSRSFGMPFPHPTSAPLTNLPGLSRLSRLSIGLYPATYAPLLAFLRSLPPATSSPFTSLRAVTITNPPTNCTGHDLEATANVAALQAAVVDKTIVLSFASQSWEWDAGNAWARPIGIGGGGGHGGALRANGGQGMWAAGAGFGLFRGFGGAGGGGAFPPLRRFVAARAAPAAGGGQPGVVRVRRPQGWPLVPAVLPVPHHAANVQVAFAAVPPPPPTVPLSALAPTPAAGATVDVSSDDEGIPEAHEDDGEAATAAGPSSSSGATTAEVNDEGQLLAAFFLDPDEKDGDNERDA